VDRRLRARPVHRIAVPEILQHRAAVAGRRHAAVNLTQLVGEAGIGRWHTHEGRHTAVSIMSSNGVAIQDISDTVGHKSTHVTETVYRHVIVPEIRGGATVMDDVFYDDEDDTDEGSEEAGNDLGSGSGSKPSNRCPENGGAKGIRTPDLLHAMQHDSV
jgi:hypothetical protein